jgi:hypothetical protein
MTTMPDPIFTHARDGVLMDLGGPTILLTPAQVSDMLDLYEQGAKQAEADAARCRKRFNALWDARCAALDAVCSRKDAA